jgi:hypothetical protein
MGIAFIKMDTARVKWRVKLADAFAHSTASLSAAEKKNARAGKWALLLLPLITVLREGLEAVVFVGGVSLSTPATSIPIAVIVGLIAGGIIGMLHSSNTTDNQVMQSTALVPTLPFTGSLSSPPAFSSSSAPVSSPKVSDSSSTTSSLRVSVETLPRLVMERDPTRLRATFGT